MCLGPAEGRDSRLVGCPVQPSHRGAMHLSIVSGASSMRVLSKASDLIKVKPAMGCSCFVGHLDLGVLKGPVHCPNEPLA